MTLNYLSNFWEALEIYLENYETNLLLTSSNNYVMKNATRHAKFVITNAKLCIPVVSLSTKNILQGYRN